MNKKEVLSNRQAISLVILFLVGEGSIFIQGINAEKDIWISMLIAIVAAIPVIIMFARLHALFPNKNIYDMMESCFGKVLGRFFIVLFVWYCFHAISLLLEDLGFFISTVMFLETPTILSVGAFAFISAYIIKQGIEVFGRWAELFLVVPLVLIGIVLLLLIPKMDLNNLFPIAYNGPEPILKGAFLTWGFPFVTIVAFLSVFQLSHEKNSPYKIYLIGFFIGFVLLFIIYNLVLLVLGDYLAGTLYYPTYVMVSRISIGNFLQRLDVIAAIIYLIGICVQVSVCLLGACKGICKLCNCNDYRFIVFPVALFAMNLTSYESESIMAFFEFAIDVWPYYVLPFELLIPLLVWVAAEIKIRRQRKKLGVRNLTS